MNFSVYSEMHTIYRWLVVLNVPNMITIGRILLVPFVGMFLYWCEGANLEDEKFYGFWAMIIFAIAGFSDLVDGYYARKYKQVSVMGKFFDPLADKLIHMTALIFLIPLNRLSAWLVVVLLSREIFITGLRSMAIGEGIVMDAATLGKTKTAWLNAGIGLLLYYHVAFAGTFFEIQTHLIGMVCLLIGLFFSVVSGAQYTYSFFKQMKMR